VRGWNMGYTNCNNSVMGVIEEASKQFGASLTVTQASFDRIEKICDMVDNLAQESLCEYVDVDVDELSRKLTISLTCDDLELHGGRTNEFFSLIKMVDSFGFSVTSDGLLKIEFNICWIWEGTGGR